MEFRGQPYSKWEIGHESNFQRLHDALKGWHASILHSGQVLTLLPQHAEYDLIMKVLDEVGMNTAINLANSNHERKDDPENGL